MFVELFKKVPPMNFVCLSLLTDLGTKHKNNILKYLLGSKRIDMFNVNKLKLKKMVSIQINFE